MFKSAVWTLSLFCLIGIAGISVDRAFARDMQDVLKELRGLHDDEREARLIDGAKQERKVVLYGTTGVDDMKVLFDAFKKKYPFLEVGHYRSGARDWACYCLAPGASRSGGRDQLSQQHQRSSSSDCRDPVRRRPGHGGAGRHW